MRLMLKQMLLNAFAMSANPLTCHKRFATRWCTVIFRPNTLRKVILKIVKATLTIGQLHKATSLEKISSDAKITPARRPVSSLFPWHIFHGRDIHGIVVDHAKRRSGRT